MTTSQIDPASYYAFHRTSYRPYLIRSKTENLVSDYDREKVAREDPYGYKLTHLVAEAICSNGFDIEGTYDKTSWEDRNYDELLQSIQTECLIHGHCVVELFDKDPFFDVYSGKEISNVLFKDHKPSTVHININIGNESDSRDLIIDNKTVFWIEYGSQRDWKGISYYFASWDIITYLRLITHNMAQYDSRLGSGFPKVQLTKDIMWNDNTIKEINSFLSNLDSLDSKAGVVVPQGVEFVIDGQKNTVNFPEHMITLIQKLSAATGFPLKYFTGDPKGAVSAANEDGNMIRSRLEQIFGSIKKKILKILKVIYPNITSIRPIIIVAIDEQERETLTDETDTNKSVAPSVETFTAKSRSTKSYATDVSRTKESEQDEYRIREN